MKGNLFRKTAGVCGIASQIVALTVLLVVVRNSPWFSWTEYNLSVLGEEGSLRVVFNWGIIISGLFNLVFTVGLRKNLVLNRMGASGVVIFSIGAVAFAATGVFPRSIELPHDIVSVGFYILVILGFFLVGIAATASSRVEWGLPHIAGGLLIPALLWIPWTWEADAVPQLLACLPWSLWTIAFSVVLLVRTAPIDLRKVT